MSIEESLSRQALSLERIAEALEKLTRLELLEKVKSAEVKSAEVKSAEVKSAEVKSAEVKSAEVKSAEVKSAEVKSATPTLEEVKAVLQARVKTLVGTGTGLSEAKAKEQVKALVLEVGKVDGVTKLTPEGRAAVFKAATVPLEKALPTITEEVLREAMRSAADFLGRDALRAIVVEVSGAQTLAEVLADKRGAIVEAVKAAVAAKVASASDEDF